MVQCFVYNCPTGRKSCKERLSLFKVPSDAKMLQKWRETVPQKQRLLSSSDRICERHFESRYVIPRYQQIQGKGGDYYQDLIRPKLTPNAVPTIFPGIEKRNDSLLKHFSFEPKLCVTQPKLAIIAQKEPESLVSLMTREIANGIEVSETDSVSVCFTCLVGTCSSHAITIV